MDELVRTGRPTRDLWFLVLAAGLGFLGGVIGAKVSDRVFKDQGLLAPRGVVTRSEPPEAPQRDSSQKEVVVDIVARVSPAVVAVIVSKDVPQLEEIPVSPFGDGFFGPSPFRFRIRRPTGEVEQREIGGGSGFVVDADGLILTNKHVVSDEEATYDVVFTTGERVSAKVIARDPVLDLAVLRVEKKDLPVVSLGDSDTLRVGQTVIAIGNALGEFRNTVSVGVVSGLGRQVRAGDQATGEVEVLDHVIQTDAAINVGNSGGPLIDLSGRAIGVSTAVAGGAENIGFALPITEAARVLRDVREHGRVIRPMLGVRYVLITPALQSELKLPDDHGALIVRGDTPGAVAVLPGSAADKAGLKEGDIILEIDGEKVTPDRPLQSFIRVKRPGDVVTLTVLSGSERKTVRVTLEEARSR